MGSMERRPSGPFLENCWKLTRLIGKNSPLTCVNWLKRWSMNDYWKFFLRFRGMRELLLRVHLSLVAVVFPLLVLMLPLRSLIWLVERWERWNPYRGIPADHIIALVHRRFRHPILMRRRRCLRHGMILFHFLRLAGLPAEMYFGVLAPADSGKPLDAHCWVRTGEREIDPPEGNAAVMVTCTYEPRSP